MGERVKQEEGTRGKKGKKGEVEEGDGEGKQEMVRKEGRSRENGKGRGGDKKE